MAESRLAIPRNGQERLTEFGKDRGQVRQREPFARAIPHLLPQQQGLLVVAPRLELVPKVIVDAADVVE
jgi:hypothetical protein